MKNILILMFILSVINTAFAQNDQDDSKTTGGLVVSPFEAIKNSLEFRKACKDMKNEFDKKLKSDEL